MVSFHALGVGNSSYLRGSSQQIKQCKGLWITSAYHPSPSTEELQATAAPLGPRLPTALFRSLHDTAALRAPGQDSTWSQREVRCLIWGTCALGKVISYLHLLPFSFLKALPFASHMSASIFSFPRPGFQLCLLQLCCLSPACLPLAPSSRWRSDGEEGEGTCGDFQAVTWGLLSSHKSSALCSPAKSNEMQWGTTSQGRRRVLFSLRVT